MTPSGAGTSDARRNRVTSVGLVVAFLLGTRAAIPEAELRASVQYLCVVTLGYGHLLGPVVLRRSRRGGAPSLLVDAFWASTAFTGFAAYAWAVARVPALILPLLAVSAWHTVENDLAIGRAYANGLRVEAMPRRWGYHGVSLGVTGLVVLLGMWTESWRELVAGLGWMGAGDGATSGRSGLAGAIATMPWLDLPDLFVLVTLHHLLSWLVLLLDRVRALRAAGRRDEAARLCTRLLSVHLVPAAVCIALLAVSSPRAGTVHLFVFGPAVYLYWSVLHVVQTSWRRGIEPVDVTPRGEATLGHP